MQSRGFDVIYELSNFQYISHGTLCAGICLCVHVACVCGYMSVCTCSMCVYICVCIYIYRYVCMSIDMCMCVYIHTHLCVCRDCWHMFCSARCIVSCSKQSWSGSATQKLPPAVLPGLAYKLFVFPQPGGCKKLGRPLGYCLPYWAYEDPI